MATYYCRASTTDIAHLPYPGVRVTADNPQAAAAAYSITAALPPNKKILVVEESALTWFDTGGVAPGTGPTYT